MNALVDHRLGEIEGGDTGILEEMIVEQHLVHARAGIRQREIVLERGEKVIGVEHRIARGLPEPIRPHAHHVGQRPDKDPELAVEPLHPAVGFAFRIIGVLDQMKSILAGNHVRQRRVRHQRCRQHHRPRPRTAAAVRRGECLVQIEVHAVDAQIPRPDPPDNGVEVGPIAVDIAAGGVDGIRHVLHVALEQAAGVGIGDHDGGDVVVDPVLERRQIHPARLVRRDGLHRIAAHMRARRIGAVGGFGHQYPLAGAAPVFERRPDGHQARQLSVGAGRRRHGDARHPGERRQPPGTFVDQRERPLHRAFGLQGVDVGKSGQPRHLLVEPGVMLHGA